MTKSRCGCQDKSGKGERNFVTRTVTPTISGTCSILQIPMSALNPTTQKVRRTQTWTLPNWHGSLTAPPNKTVCGLTTCANSGTVLWGLYVYIYTYIRVYRTRRYVGWLPARTQVPSCEVWRYVCDGVHVGCRCCLWWCACDAETTPPLINVFSVVGAVCDGAHVTQKKELDRYMYWSGHVGWLPGYVCHGMCACVRVLCECVVCACVCVCVCVCGSTTRANTGRRGWARGRWTRTTFPWARCQTTWSASSALWAHFLKSR